MAVLNSGKEGEYMARKGYKYEAIKAAKDLFYGSRVIELINSAKSEAEIERIMCTARQEKNGRDVKQIPQKAGCKLDMSTFTWC